MASDHRQNDLTFNFSVSGHQRNLQADIEGSTGDRSHKTTVAFFLAEAVIHFAKLFLL